jgi:hypothetical protein
LFLIVLYRGFAVADLEKTGCNTVAGLVKDAVPFGNTISGALGLDVSGKCQDIAKKAREGAVAQASQGANPARTKSASNLANYTRDELRQLQQKLNDAGIMGKNGKPLTVDGLKGGNTQHALNQYLKSMSGGAAASVKDVLGSSIPSVSEVAAGVGRVADSAVDEVKRGGKQFVEDGKDALDAIGGALGNLFK